MCADAAHRRRTRAGGASAVQRVAQGDGGRVRVQTGAGERGGEVPGCAGEERLLTRGGRATVLAGGRWRGAASGAAGEPGPACRAGGDGVDRGRSSAPNPRVA